MEYVSVLAGKPFTDHPKCTHPALAALARLVNDSIVDEEARSRLALLAPDLIGVTGDPRMTHCVISSCLVAAVAARPWPLPAAQRRLTKTSARMRWLRREDRWNRIRLRSWELLNPPHVIVGSAFQLAVERMHGLGPRQKDARLTQLLHDAVVECQMLDGGPDHAANRPSARAS